MLVATHQKKLAVFDPNSLVENTGAAVTVPDSNGVIYNPTNGLVYVSDKVNHIVRAYTTGGVAQPANNLGYGAGSGFGQLNTPSGLAVDSSGNIYVADSGNNRIQIFSPSNQLVNTIGSVGAGPGQLRTPYGVTISPATGLVWVADYLNQRFTGYVAPAP
jgi:sugar lactone lactonase YvrE